MTKALGKEGSFAEGPSNSPRQRFFWKNPENFFAEGQRAGPRQRFLKKNSKKKLFLCRGPALGKQFFFKKNLCRGPPSAKVFLGKILKISLPRAREEALGKGFLKKNKKIYLPRAGPRQKN